MTGVPASAAGGSARAQSAAASPGAGTGPAPGAAASSATRATGAEARAVEAVTVEAAVAEPAVADAASVESVAVEPVAVEAGHEERPGAAGASGADAGERQGVLGDEAEAADGRDLAEGHDSADAHGSADPHDSASEDEDGGDQDGAARAARGRKIAAAAVNQASVWNVANLLTMLRLVLVPAFVALLLGNGGYDPAWRSFAWAAFAIAMITDLFDGHLARTYNLVTDFGKIADPIADKAIMGAALICLSALGDLPWWVTVVILGRELGITLMRFLVIRYGVIPASRGGKLKTLAQGVAVGMYVLALTGPLATLRFWVMAVAVALTVVTGFDYIRQAVVLRRRGIAERSAALRKAQG